MADILREVVARNRAGQRAAIPSVCSAHPDVLRASLELARDLGQAVVIEATSNQVNQDGGYTGMRPEDFVRFVRGIAQEVAIDPALVLLGGDHLGPQAWRRGDVATAMAKAHRMVADYAAAGFTKIHLDCSEGCAGEPAQLPDAVCAARAAELAESALDSAPDPARLILVVGTEVPPPGGARTDDHGDIPPTTPEAARATLRAHRAAFSARAWAQVAGLVVQPGVEFSPMEVHRLPMARDPGLRAVLDDWPGLCLEAHSTDYQHPAVYPRLAELGFAFQKVGPALTFAWRQAVYALDLLRGLAGWQTGPALPGVMERLMLAAPGNWQGHYHGADLRLARHFGLADRIRYYWPQPEAQAAVAGLFADLAGRALPVPLLEQVFAPDIIAAAAAGEDALPQALVRAQVQAALRPYFLDSPTPNGKEPRP